MEASKRERERKTFIETRPLLYFFWGGCFAQFDSRSFTHKHCYVPRTYNTPSAHIVFICILTLYDGVSWKLLGLNRSISRSYITIKWNENQRNKKTNIVVLVLCVRCVRVCFGWFGKKYSTNKKQHQQQQQPTKSHLCVRSLFLFSLFPLSKKRKFLYFDRFKRFQYILFGGSTSFGCSCSVVIVLAGWIRSKSKKAAK